MNCPTVIKPVKHKLSLPFPVFEPLQRVVNEATNKGTLRGVETCLSYLTPIGAKRTENSWMYETVLLECVDNGSSGLRPARVSIRSNDDQRDFIRNVELCRQVSDVDLGSGPTRKMLDTVFLSVTQAVSSEVLPLGGTYELKVVITFEGDKHKVSIRNTGKAKYSAAEMRSFRPKFLSALSENLRHSKNELRAFYKDAREMFDQLKEERLAKERSIDDILGI